MKKAQLPLIAELDLGDTKDSTAKVPCKFIGTDTPRFLRAIHALLAGPLPREQFECIEGCSNGPAVVSELRDLGLGKDGLLCTKVPDRDCDGFAIHSDVYYLSDAGCRAINTWLRLRDKKAKP